jgi:hypothetical protein
MTDDVRTALAAALPKVINFRFLPPRLVTDPIWQEVAADLAAAEPRLTLAAPVDAERLRGVEAAARAYMDRPVGAADEPTLRKAAQRLSDAIADKLAVDGLIASGHLSDWKAQMNADDEFYTALKALRTAVDGRPR